MPKAYRDWLVPLLFYAVCSAVLNLALFPHLFTQLAGVGDNRVFVNRLARTAWDLWHGHSLFVSRWEIAPGGANLAWDTLDLAVGVVLAPVVTIVGVVPAYNLAILFLPILNALSMDALVGEYSPGKPGRLLAGFLYGFSPFLLAHADVGHLNLITVFWLPLLLRILVRIDRGQISRRRGGGYLALIGAGILYTDQELTLFAAFMVLFLFGKGLWRLRASLAVGALGAGLLTLPFWRAFLAGAGRMASSAPLAQMTAYSAQPLNYFLPGPFEVLGLLLPFYRFTLHTGAVTEETQFLGLALLLILPILLGFGWRDPSGRPFARLFLLAFLFSLGPELRLRDLPMAIPMPAALLSFLPGLSLLAEYARFGLLATMALSVLAGIWWNRRMATRKAAPVWLGGFLALQTLTIYPAWLTTGIRIPEAFRQAARVARGRVVLSLPYAYLASSGSVGMPGATGANYGYVYQGLQTRPLAAGPPYRLVDGYVAKLPPAVLRQAEENRFLAAMAAEAVGRAREGTVNLPLLVVPFRHLVRRDAIAAVMMVPDGGPWQRTATRILATAGWQCRLYRDGSRYCQAAPPPRRGR